MRKSHCYRVFQWTPRKQHPSHLSETFLDLQVEASEKKPWIWALGCVPSHLVWSSNTSVLHEMTGATLCRHCLAQCALCGCRLLFSTFYLKAHLHLQSRNIKICFTEQNVCHLKNEPCVCVLYNPICFTSVSSSGQNDTQYTHIIKLEDCYMVDNPFDFYDLVVFPLEIHRGNTVYF